MRVHHLQGYHLHLNCYPGSPREHHKLSTPSHPINLSTSLLKGKSCSVEVIAY